MYYNEFQGLKLSGLGFGAMRLPVLSDGSIDEEQVYAMVRYAADHGVNYYDTAYPYHASLSEVSLGKALKQLPRESFFLADKYPGHQIASHYDPAAIFEEQLEKCGVDYFDFYLMHNVNELSVATYNDPQWNMIPYFIEQREKGRIRHLGFSCHAFPDTLESFLQRWDGVFEFCQIQLNYLDWTLQDAEKKVEILDRHHIPVWVMEPVRGGKLANLGEENNRRLEELHPDESVTSWALRYLQGIPSVKMILSGMSAMEQMVDNVKTFETHRPLTEEETKVLYELAEQMKDAIPCTACRYCCAGCPKRLDIPRLLAIYNDIRFSPAITVTMNLEGLGEEQGPDSCVKCGKCAKACPQKINVPKELADFAKTLETLPKWAEICKKREEAAKAARNR